MNQEPLIRIARTDVALRAADLDHQAWRRAESHRITRYWSGAEAPPGRHAAAQLLASAGGLAVRFVAAQQEPLVVDPRPQTKSKTIGLWERDVCEIFVAPNAERPDRYFEFEVAPTGAWVDLAIHQKPNERETEWKYESGMSAAARVADKEITLAVFVPWAAFRRSSPIAGERWRGNLFRCVGAGENRGYLAWSPTGTPQPNFHVPRAFGWFEFQ